MFSKKELRRLMKDRLEALPPESFHGEGEAAALRLAESPLWSRFGTVLLFLSMKNEIDTGPLLETALGKGKKVFVPRVEGKELAFYRAFSPSGPWRRGPFGIREPEADTDALLPGDFPALVVVPALAFDREGNRLGRGGGYYDRFLEALNRGALPYAALGFCMDAQILHRVPVGKGDRRVDGVCHSASAPPPSAAAMPRHMPTARSRPGMPP